ncbi:MAG: hypothetical protein LBJ61_01365 [Deltaproteobacteria bacterium]|nr:hypothetical protein [Deltaproteobacteria bacterium]
MFNITDPNLNDDSKTARGSRRTAPPVSPVALLAAILAAALMLTAAFLAPARAQAQATGQVQAEEKASAEAQVQAEGQAPAEAQEGFGGQPGSAWAEPERARAIFLDSAKRLNLQTKPGGDFVTEKMPDPILFPKEIFIVLGAGLGLFFLFFLVRAIIKSKRAAKKSDPDKKPTEDGDDLDTEALEATGLKADLLASQGFITEAMHALLLETIEELKNQKNMSFPNSHTSREIAGSLNLGHAATKCLGDIVTAVEPTWFGEAKPDINQYLGLKATFDAFLDILSPGRTQKSYHLGLSENGQPAGLAG